MTQNTALFLFLFVRISNLKSNYSKMSFFIHPHGENQHFPPQEHLGSSCFLISVM